MPRRAGSRRTIYARYGDKDTLFKAALQRAIDHWIVPAQILRQTEADDLQETLIAIARFGSPISIWPRVCASSASRTEVFHDPDVARYLWEQTAEPTIGYLTELFSRRLRPGEAEIPDAHDAAAAFLILVVEGSGQLAIWGRMAPDDYERQTTYRTRIFLKGAVAQPDGTPRL